MKTLVLSMISIAATVAAMTACTSEGDPIDEIDNGQPVEIKLNAGVVQTKAAIDVDESNHPKAEVSNVYFYREDKASSSTPDWTSPTGFVGTIGIDGTITPGSPQYYATDGNNAFIAGLYLGGETSTVPEVSTGKVSFTIDGSQDILWAEGIDKGNRGTPINAALNFKHQLTQFKFVAKTASGIGEITGIKVKIQGANTKSAINLADGTLDTWDTVSTISVEDLTAAANAGTSTASKGTMLEPNLKSLAIQVTAGSYLTSAVSLTINGKDGTGNDSFEAGKAYTITLSFAGKEVSATATISPWADGTAPDEGKVE